MTLPRPHVRSRPLALVLGLAAALALVQQQLLVRQPPRLDRLLPAAASSGPAALQARFSRPMQRASVAADSVLSPALKHRWLGDGDTLLLSLEPGQRIRSPLRLSLAGRDRRGLALTPQRWQWDPRPRLLAVVPVDGGEQVQLRDHDGRWQPITPIWPRITMVEPLGGGSAVAVVARSENGRFRVWRVPLSQQALRPLGRDAPTAPAASGGRHPPAHRQRRSALRPHQRQPPRRAAGAGRRRSARPGHHQPLAPQRRSRACCRWRPAAPCGCCPGAVRWWCRRSTG